MVQSAIGSSRSTGCGANSSGGGGGCSTLVLVVVVAVIVERHGGGGECIGERVGRCKEGTCVSECVCVCWGMGGGECLRVCGNISRRGDEANVWKGEL